ncbi:MAG TPA: FHA domain-containing protein [Ktedonobacterales bacterium]|jgi:predicted component of type VI protein secretion system
MRTLTLSWQAQGQWQQYTVTAERPCVIGRQAEACQITLDDRSVSRQHASVYAENGAFHLRNLSQTSSIAFNQRFRLTYSQDTPLKPGDTFRLGTTRFWVMQPRQPEVKVLKIKCARCGKLVDSHLEGFCPWCGRSLANGEIVEVEP